MGKYDNYLTDKNGKPYRNPDGKLIPLSGFDGDPTYDPEIYERPLAVVVEEMLRLDIPVPDELLIDAVEELRSLDNPVPERIIKELEKVYLLEEDGTPYRTADGKLMRLAYFDNDPVDISPDPTDKEIDEDIRALGLSEYLPDGKAADQS